MVTLTTYWPAMKINPEKLLRLWMTEDEVATGHLDFGDGTGIDFHSIDLPPTSVIVSRGVLRAFLTGNGPVATVATCVAQGSEPEAKVSILLSPEPVVMEDSKLIAKSMSADVIVVFGSDVYLCTGSFPDCPVEGGVAQPLTVVFDLVKQ
jgi:hypothetical protein